MLFMRENYFQEIKAMQPFNMKILSKWIMWARYLGMKREWSPSERKFLSNCIKQVK
jgi:hypothetical protein